GSESKIIASESDWLLARQLCPTSRQLYRYQMLVTLKRGNLLFEPNEAGHPLTFAGCMEEIRMMRFHSRSHNDVAEGQPRNTRLSAATDESVLQLEVNP